MDYSKLSDFEINKMVAELFHNPDDTGGGFGQDIYMVFNGLDSCSREFNPCNNPSDAWPIIFESEINIQFRHGADLPPMARHCDFYHVDKNPLRAAMIVYLMMNEDK